AVIHRQVGQAATVDIVLVKVVTCKGGFCKKGFFVYAPTARDCRGVFRQPAAIGEERLRAFIVRGPEATATTAARPTLRSIDLHSARIGRHGTFAFRAYRALRLCIVLPYEQPGCPRGIFCCYFSFQIGPEYSRAVSRDVVAE